MKQTQHWALAAALGAGMVSLASGQGMSKDSCAELSLPTTPTDVKKTYIRKGFGEYGATRQEGESTHKGVDITRNQTDSDPAATAVLAVSGGVVAYSRVNGSASEGYGNVVVVDHQNGCYSMYAHISNKPFTPLRPGGNLDVKAGDQIKAGQRIGFFVDIKADTTSTGNAVKTDPAAREQVHFQLIQAPPGRKDDGSGSIKGTIVRDDGIVVDPTKFLLGLGYVIK